jgi:hypothetical protein
MGALNNRPAFRHVAQSCPQLNRPLARIFDPIVPHPRVRSFVLICQYSQSFGRAVRV